MHPNFRHLVYLVATAEHGSISAAAEAIGISQPAISAAIKNVEADLGYRLFVRNPAQGLTLTPSGRQFIRRTKQLLNEVRAFEKASKGLGGALSGEVELGCYFLTAPYFVPPLLKTLAKNHPAIAVNLHERDLAGLVADLKRGVTEIALTYDMYQDSAIVFEKLFEVCPHVILAPNDPLAKQETVSLKQLVGRQMAAGFADVAAVLRIRAPVRHVRIDAKYST